MGYSSGPFVFSAGRFFLLSFSSCLKWQDHNQHPVTILSRPPTTVSRISSRQVALMWEAIKEQYRLGTSKISQVRRGAERSGGVPKWGTSVVHSGLHAVVYMLLSFR